MDDMTFGGVKSDTPSRSVSARRRVADARYRE
jgi:hypothetical protein